MTTKYFFALSLAIFCNNFTAVAQTWTNVISLRLDDGAVVTMSADGCKLAATSSTAHVVYASTDGGNTWQTNQSPGSGCFGIASSADGTKLVASVGGGTAPVYTSTNSGSNWMAVSATTANNAGLSSSALGNILTVAGTSDDIGPNGFTSGSLYVSTNSGLAWITNLLNKGCLSVASSADGTKLAAAAYQDKIYVSTNFGTTWTATKSPTNFWFSIACSADGTKLIASGTNTYISTDFGGHWTLANTNAGYVASSADGTKLIIAGAGDVLDQNLRNPNYSIYTSSDSGVTWVSNRALDLGWSSVASSADGSELLAIANDYDYREIWIGRTTPSPQINLEMTNSNLVLSWLVSSTNFVLQQSSDLTTDKWVTLTNAPTFDPSSLQNQITLLQSNASPRFFRLSTQ